MKPPRTRPFKGRLIVLRGRIIAGVYGDTEADQIIRSVRNRYLKAGLVPPPMTTTVLHGREWLDSWVTEDLFKRCTESTGKGTP